MKLYWPPETTPVELRAMLKTLGEEYPLVEGKGPGLELSFARTDDPGVCEVACRNNRAIIGYSTSAQAGRALGALLSALAAGKQVYRERTPFTMLGVMLDCSRNAVVTVAHMQKWMRRLALLGYNMLMLYTEDTYELPGETYFGFQRGAYTKAEMQALDDYAARLNIELIPCIQTLGHLEQILRHPAYEAIKDTSSVVLVGEPKTYRLIEKMIKHWSSICRARRIHIGMDEAHDLGRGRYHDLHGYRRAFDLFNEHLAKVVKICEKYGLTPMIWSDMYFRMASKTGNSYYDPAIVIPREITRVIPRDVQLVYWDYYHRDKDFYRDWIERHRKMNKEPLMASGIFTWDKYWYDHRYTEAAAGPCVEACREANLKEIIFTMWGDNGAYCDHDSALAGVVWCADKAYGINRPAPAGLEKRFAAVCGGSYAAHILAGDIHGGVGGVLNPAMWSDPLAECTGNSPKRLAELAKGFSGLASKLKPHCRDRQTGDLKHAYNIARAFAGRYALAAGLLAAYRKRDRHALARIQKQGIPRVIGRARAMADSFRGMWLRHNKPYGLATIQGRFGMVEARYREMAQRIKEYLRDRLDAISELD